MLLTEIHSQLIKLDTYDKSNIKEIRVNQEGHDRIMQEMRRFHGVMNGHDNLEFAGLKIVLDKDQKEIAKLIS